MKKRVTRIVLASVAAFAGRGAAAGVEVCEVHRVALSKGAARVTYGLPAPPPEGYRGALKEKFPHSNLKVNGGCVVNPARPDATRGEAEVTFCPKCRAAEGRWLRRHRRK